jgi:hypothetical protein
MLGRGSSLLILNNLGPRLCKGAPDRLIENKGISKEFGNSSTVREKNTPWRLSQRSQKPAVHSYREGKEFNREHRCRSTPATEP